MSRVLCFKLCIMVEMSKKCLSDKAALLNILKGRQKIMQGFTSYVAALLHIFKQHIPNKNFRYLTLFFPVLLIALKKYALPFFLDKFGNVINVFF